MSPSRKSDRSRGLRRSHVSRRHGRIAPRAAPPMFSSPPPAEPSTFAGAPTDAPPARLDPVEHAAPPRGQCRGKGRDPDPHACLHPLVRHIIALEAAGWHVIALRPRSCGDAPPLWRVTIERYDEGASMTLTEADPEVALAELVRYAQADAA